MTLPPSLIERLRAGAIVPYLGPLVLELVPEYAVPATPEALAARLTAKGGGAAQDPRSADLVCAIHREL